MRLKNDQKSLDNLLPEYNLRPHEDEDEKEEEEDDFNVGDADEDYDCKVPPMFI
jgi:hypothetical protein